MRVRLGLIGLGLLAGMAAAACGDDDGAGTGGSGGTTSSAGGVMATSSSAGGSPPMVVCDLDNKCTSDEHCACSDCWFANRCNAIKRCNADGICEPDESCDCADCSSEPECTDYCVNCRTYTTYFLGRDSLCPNSATLFADLQDCACNVDSPCLGNCQASLCQGLDPSQACRECVAEFCEAPRDACFADAPRVIQCNPVTQEGCNPAQGNERCDILTMPEINVPTFAPRSVIGFQCKLATNDADKCTACDYQFASPTKCARGNTCVDPSGDVVFEGTCGRFCCDDADCGTGGVGSCQKGAFAPAASDLGTCITGTMPTDPGCDAPGVGMSTSMGSCVTLD